MKNGDDRGLLPGRGSSPKFGLWKVLLWILLLWVILSYFYYTYGEKESLEISYSTFLTQVQKGDVGEVTFQGSKITGKFKKAYTVDQEGRERSYQAFSTIKPPVEDPDLLRNLQANEVAIQAKADNSTWIYYLLLFSLPWLLLIGYSIYSAQGRLKRMSGGGLFNVGKSKARRYRHSASRITFDEVAGLENAKQDLREIIDYLKEPKKFTALGADIPKGILLMGPPGIGKTLLAKATAGEAKVPFYSISGSEFIEMFVGVGASRVRDLFENAKRDAPAIIFIDEIDSVGRARGTGLGGGHDEREQTLNQILNEMDGFEPNESVVVMAATNRPDVLDSALVRPGRFDRQITLDLPHKKARLDILMIHTRDVPLEPAMDLDNIAKRTVGFSGADLRNVVNEAALLAGRKGKTQVGPQDFEEARDKIMLGAEREEKMEEEDKRLVAYHEAGHALVAKLLPGTDPLQKVTIIPRGRALGATEQIPEQDKYNLSRQYLRNRIAVALGGRVSERLVFGELTSGAANDLKMVTQIARRMVCQWGMSERLGPMTFRQGEEHPFLGREITQPTDFSEHTARIIDEEIQSIILEQEAVASQIIKDNRASLDALAQALLENETLEKEDVDRLVV